MIGLFIIILLNTIHTQEQNNIVYIIYVQIFLLVSESINVLKFNNNNKKKREDNKNRVLCCSRYADVVSKQAIEKENKMN